MPNQTPAVVTWRTAVATRSGRGRTYHVGLAESQCSGRYLNVADRDAILAGWTNFREAFNADPDPIGGSAHMGVYSKTQDVFRDITAIVMDRNIDTQRRRAPTTRVF
jgi:hypothetical protein